MGIKTTVDDLLKRTFIKLRSDFGFKRAFSSPENVEVLKKFLNALFEGKMEITDVTFQDKGILPVTAKGKRSYYDAYCTTSDGNHFVVEMQRKPAKFFGNLKIMFVSLNQVGKEWDDCKTELERRLYLIKNMEKLNKSSKPYLTGEYEEMFNASEMACMAAEDIVEYRNSLVDEMERESELEYAKKYAKEEGLQEGRAEGRAEAQLDMAKKMKLNGLPLGDIMLYTGLTEEQVRDL